MAGLQIRILNELPATLEQGVLYITKDAETGYLEITRLDAETSQARSAVSYQNVNALISTILADKADIGHVHEITDIAGLQVALNNKQSVGDYAMASDLTQKQDLLVSGETIKTVNGQNILGSGDIELVNNTNHSLLTNLDADDHPQYFNQVRGDARYANLIHEHSLSDIIGLEDYLTIAYGDSHYVLSDTFQTDVETILQSKLVAGTNISLTVENGKLVISSSLDLGAYVSQAEFDAHEHAISDIQSLQTVLDSKQPVGDYVTTTVLNQGLSLKQDTLIDNVNIKTLDGQSLLGTGTIGLKTINGQSIIGLGDIQVNLDNATVSTVAGRIGDVVLTKTDVGLDQVDNTSDLDKPISTAQQEALDSKADIAGATMTGPLQLYGDATQPLEAVPKQQHDALLSTLPVIDNNSNLLVKRTGEDMLGPLGLVGDATQPLEAVPKQQLDQTSLTDRDRSNHTGTQTIDTVDGLQEALDSKHELLVDTLTIKTVQGISLLGAGDLLVSHTGLSGLDADDHPQYFNETRGDARYQQIATLSTDLTSFLVAGNNIQLTDQAGLLTVSADVLASVDTVNGKTGDVVLTASDVGAEPVGASAAAITAHKAETDPHTQYLKPEDIIAGQNVTVTVNPGPGTVELSASVMSAVDTVNGKVGDVVLSASDVGADAAGTAASFLLTHTEDTDPHPQYFNQARADTRYANKVHSHQPSEISGLLEYVQDGLASTLKPGNAVSVVYDDTSGQITIGTSASPGSGNEFVVFNRNGSVANQVHTFKLPETQTSFDLNAYALKEVPALLSQSYIGDTFDNVSKDRYLSTSKLVFNGVLKPLTGGTYTLGFTDPYYTTPVETGMESFSVRALEKTDTIPLLTKDDMGNGFVSSASSTYSSTYAAYKAFSRSVSDAWITGAKPTIIAPQWLKIKLAQPERFDSYTLANRLYSDPTSPKTWTIEGSMDDVSWITLHTVTSDTNNTSGGVRSYNFSNDTSYLYYRIHITDTNSTIGYVAIAEWTLINKPKLNILGGDGKYYRVSNGNLIEVSSAFSQTFYDSGVILETSLTGKLPLTVVSENKGSINLSYKPFSQIAIQSVSFDAKRWSAINSVTLTKNKIGDGSVRIAVLSPNLDTWMMFDGTSWVSVGPLTNDTSSANTLLQNGMTSEVLGGISKGQWNDLFALSSFGAPDQLAFAYAFGVPDPTVDSISIDTIAMNVDYRAGWRIASSSEVVIQWYDTAIEFKTLVAGNYKMAFHVPANLAAGVGDATNSFTEIPQDFLDGYYIGLSQP